MSIDINNINPLRPDSARSQGASNEAKAEVKGQVDSSQTAASSASTDNVSLSSTAKALTQIESDLKQLPEVNQAKVDAIKAKIDNGSYQIDSDNMAQKMLDLES